MSDVSCALSQYISSEKVIGISKKETDVKPEKESTEKLCPKCSSELALKVAKKGKNIGNEFWACSAFPKCRFVEGKNL